jgi:hypothetical protein
VRVALAVKRTSEMGISVMSHVAHCEIGGTGKIGRGRGIADMAGPAVGSTQSRMTLADVSCFADRFSAQRVSVEDMPARE